MKTATYRALDGKDFTVEYDPEGPCVACGLPVVEASRNTNRSPVLRSTPISHHGQRAVPPKPRKATPAEYEAAVSLLRSMPEPEGRQRMWQE